MKSCSSSVFSSLAYCLESYHHNTKDQLNPHAALPLTSELGEESVREREKIKEKKKHTKSYEIKFEYE